MGFVSGICILGPLVIGAFIVLSSGATLGRSEMGALVLDSGWLSSALDVAVLVSVPDTIPDDAAVETADDGATVSALAFAVPIV
jgi:hypothetical protein